MIDGLKLTGYLGERQRSGLRFTAESILDLFAQRQVTASVLLRGVSGFGARHVLRTDTSLSLSEDPPIVIGAVDSAAVIEPLAGDVAAVMQRGLLTIERARLLGDDDGGPDGADTVRLTIALGRNRHIDGVPAFAWVCDVLHRADFDGATAYLGVDGTAHGERRRARFFGRNIDVPLEIVAIGPAERVGQVLPRLREKLHRPLFSVERVQVCKCDGITRARPLPLPTVDASGRPLWQKLSVYTTEDTLHDGAPIHRALVRRLREERAAGGATVLRGVWGFHGAHRPRGDAFLQFGRRVPVTTVVIDTPDRIAGSFDLIGEVTGRHGLITCETVPAVLMLDGDARRGGLGLADYPG